MVNATSTITMEKNSTVQVKQRIFCLACLTLFTMLQQDSAKYYVLDFLILLHSVSFFSLLRPVITPSVLLIFPGISGVV